MALEKLSHHDVTVNSVKLHYVRQGAGEPLMLIHGWPGFWYEWHRNIGPLAEHFDVLVPDMRGFAYSDKPDVAPEAGYTDTHYAEDIKAFLDFNNIEKIRIVTHDAGAYWVPRFARMYPERVHKLVLFDPPYPGIGMRSFEYPQVLNNWYQYFHLLPWAEDLVGTTLGTIEMYLRHFFSAWAARSDVWTDDDIKAYVDAYSQPGALRGGFNVYRAFFGGGVQTSGDLAIHMPTLILWGDSDSIMPFAWSDRIPEFFPNSTLKRIEGVGHFMMREDPDRINKEIVDFMKG
jgi:pimeloyl-ACP methyl ester carboxylesterase